MPLLNTRAAAARTLAARMWSKVGVPQLRCLLLAQSRRALSTTTSPSETSESKPELKLKARFSGSLQRQRGSCAMQSEPVPAAASGKNPGGVGANKTQRELDEELRQRMEGISGDGGASGVEYEDGKPASMKRSVRENMFRYI